MAIDNAPTNQDDRRSVFTKRGDADRAERLRHEARLLEAARHPGVVELLDVDDGLGSVVLHLAHVAGRDLLDHAALTPDELARTFASVAHTLADVHRLGVAHTNLGAEHVIVDRQLHVTLCGFGNGVFVADCSESDLDPLTLDVVAFGRLLNHELDRCQEHHAPDDREPVIIGLRHVADLADAAHHAEGGLSMADVALRVGELAGTTWTPNRSTGRNGRASLLERTGARLRRVRHELEGIHLVAAGLGIAATLIAVAVVGYSLSGARSGADTLELSGDPLVVSTLDLASSEAQDPAASTEPVSSTTSTSSAVEATLLLPAGTPCLDTVSPPPDLIVQFADTDGDGCREPWWRIDDVLWVGDERYGLGAAADFVALGDWDCDGVDTAALVVRSTGNVFFFAGWVAGEGRLTATPAGSIDGPSSIRVESLQGCDELVIETASGVTTFEERPR